MKRIIKFRVWNMTEWQMQYDDIYFTDTTLSAFIGLNWDISEEYMNRSDEVELMQFTWLYDKNWKEIYEGDIVKFMLWGNNFISSIYFTPQKWYYLKYKAVFRKAGRICSFNIFKWTEIIWNIYENPELL